MSLGWRVKNPPELAGGDAFLHSDKSSGRHESVTYVSGQDDLLNEALKDYDSKRPGRVRVSPQVALYLVKIACERPDTGVYYH